eukprot:TRINITY_DN1444_c0_g1_i1.p1 TRINITY_DN1444_c0_g1~~TRINITY_DN1444_c0_g1_i1.p1  ORF type:complete len:254 (+),score=24.60 TRINITY_DN1444_c0_g1_i1:35-763(+)
MAHYIAKSYQKTLNTIRNYRTIHANSHQTHTYHKLLPKNYPSKVFALAGFVAGSLLLSPISVGLCYEAVKSGSLELFWAPFTFLLSLPLAPAIVCARVSKGLARKWMNHPDLIQKTDVVGWSMGAHVLKWSSVWSTVVVLGTMIGVSHVYEWINVYNIKQTIDRGEKNTLTEFQLNKYEKYDLASKFSVQHIGIGLIYFGFFEVFALAFIVPCMIVIYPTGIAAGVIVARRMAKVRKLAKAV